MKQVNREHVAATELDEGLAIWLRWPPPAWPARLRRGRGRSDDETNREVTRAERLNVTVVDWRTAAAGEELRRRPRRWVRDRRPLDDELSPRGDD